MRSATALLATLIPLIGAGGWIAGHTAGERWRAAARLSAAEQDPERGSPRPHIDLVVEYEPPVGGRDLATRPSSPPRHPTGPEPAPVAVEPDPTVMQRLLTLYEKIGRAP